MQLSERLWRREVDSLSLLWLHGSEMVMSPAGRSTVIDSQGDALSVAVDQDVTSFMHFVEYASERNRNRNINICSKLHCRLNAVHLKIGKKCSGRIVSIYGPGDVKRISPFVQVQSNSKRDRRKNYSSQ